MSDNSYSDWLSHFGDQKRDAHLAESRACHMRMWNERHQSSFPVWELCIGEKWDENRDDWKDRWERCGGRFFEGDRMMAAKNDPIWGLLCGTFYDGTGDPFPPFSRSSCSYWMEICQDEAVVLGVITEDQAREFSRLYAATLPRLSDKDKKLMDELRAEFLCNDNETREKRFRKRRAALEREIEEARAQYENRSDATEHNAADRAAMFTLMNEVEQALELIPAPSDERLLLWLCESVNRLTGTSHFDQYPNWRARAWIAAATVCRFTGASADELACLEHALTLNPRAPVKRRIKSLKIQ